MLRALCAALSPTGWFALHNEGRKAGQGAESGTGTILTRWGVLDDGSAMPRTARVAPGGMVFQVLNRGVARMQLFEKAADYQAFEQVLRDTLDQSPMRICARKSGVLQPIMPLDLPVKVRPWELTVYPRSHIRRRLRVTSSAQARM